MTVATVWLPFPPSVNNLYAHGTVKGVTRRFPTTKYKRWRREAVLRIKLARMGTIRGPVAVRIGLTPPSSTRRDVDNYNKAVLDALVEARVLEDDSQVQKLLSAWDHACEEVGAFVEIGTVNAERPALSPAERGALVRLKRDGYRISEPTELIKSLIAKGYVKELPGLLEGHPQGYAAAE